MKVLGVILFLLCSLAAQSFITPKERGEMLYRMAESTACAACHGDAAEGKPLGSYDTRRGKKTIVAPALINMSGEAIKSGLKNHNFGPPFYLSDEEIAALSAWLNRND
ncbi:MAG: cytochrome c [Helicobacteraceae bacterium]|jgi:mono/diheme cytochrome c family protein|nr:cytochrome c [Helicobacteraceae bacterium]